MLFDTHTHIFLNKDDNDKIIKNLKDSGVKYIAHIGVDIESSEECINLAKQYKNTIAVVGIHPGYVSKQERTLEENMELLEKLIIENREHIKAIGECGFDFFRIDSNNLEEEKEIQERYFKAQIKLALKYDLGVVIHTRDAKDDTIRVILETQLKKYIIHCFSEDIDFAMKALYYSDQSYISFSGIVTYKSATNVAITAANIALDKILIETDCPYLAPQEKRGQENIPNYVKYNLDKVIDLRIANGKKETPEQIENQIYQNSLNFFGIK